MSLEDELKRTAIKKLIKNSSILLDDEFGLSYRDISLLIDSSKELVALLDRKQETIAKYDAVINSCPGWVKVAIANALVLRNNGTSKEQLTEILAKQIRPTKLYLKESVGKLDRIINEMINKGEK